MLCFVEESNLDVDGNGWRSGDVASLYINEYTQSRNFSLMQRI